MRKLMNKIDRFCYAHPRFGIPNLMLIIVIGNAAVWLLTKMDTTGQIASLLCGSAQGILHGQVWRLVTYVFVPTEASPIWLLVMLYFYYWIGSCLEREWGNGKFTIYYVSGMLLTAIYGVVLSAILGRDVIVSTTYLNLSMFFAFATLYPDMQVLLFFIIPIKVKWLAWADAALFAVDVDVDVAAFADRQVELGRLKVLRKVRIVIVLAVKFAEGQNVAVKCQPCFYGIVQDFFIEYGQDTGQA